MTILRKFRNELKAGIFLGILFFLTRFTSLVLLPVFVDEAIYIRWAQIVYDDPSWRFIPLTDGKQPLFMWLASALVPFIQDPLFMGRMVSVFFGFLSLVGVYVFSRYIFGKRAAFFAAFLYVFLPFTLFYDRLAVVDGMLLSLCVWTLVFSLFLMRRPSLGISFLLGITLGASLLTKSTGFFFLFLLPSTFLLLPSKVKLKDVAYRACLMSFSVAISLVCYTILRLSPFFYLIGARARDYVFLPSEVLSHPLDPFLGRIPEIAVWLGEYMTWPLFLVSLFGLGFLIIRHVKVGSTLLTWWIVPLTIEAVIAKGFTPRYFLFTIFPLVIAGGYLFAVSSRFIHSGRRGFAMMLFFLLMTPAILFDFWLLTSPGRAPIPQKEREGYVEEWSAGYGIREIAAYLIDQAKNGEFIVVGTEGTFGTLPEGLQIYVRQEKDILVLGMGQPVQILKVPDQLIQTAGEGKKSYLVVNDTRFQVADSAHLTLIGSYPKPTHSGRVNEHLLFFEVRP